MKPNMAGTICISQEWASLSTVWTWHMAQKWKPIPDEHTHFTVQVLTRSSSKCLSRDECPCPPLLSWCPCLFHTPYYLLPLPERKSRRSPPFHSRCQNKCFTVVTMSETLENLKPISLFINLDFLYSLECFSKLIKSLATKRQYSIIVR